MQMPQELRRTSGVSTTSAMRCRLTGDPLFPAAAPCEVVEDGLFFCIRGVLDLKDFAANPSSLTTLGTLPLDHIDVVRWAGLRQVVLDRPGFISHWRRYVHQVSSVLMADGLEELADELTSKGVGFARDLLRRFDEFEFVATSSEIPCAA